MIGRDEMFARLLEAEPGFQAAWDSFQEEWGREAEPPLYLALDDLARYVVGCLEAGETARFRAIFDVAERWHVEGDDYVQEAATIGLLESLQNLDNHRTTQPEDFVPWLGPRSKLRWDKLNAFWRDGTPIIA